MAAPIRNLRWTPEAHRGLQALIDSPPDGRLVAALDWDDTCIRGDISYALLRDLDRSHPDSLWTAYEAHVATDRLAAYRALAVQLLAGQTPDEVRQWTRRVFADGVAAGELEPVPEMRDLVAALTASSWEVWVVTGSPEMAVAAIAPELGIAPERVLGMRAGLDGNGRFDDRLEEPVTWREGKTQNFLAAVGQPPTLAIGDSEGDVHMLSSAHRAVWIDRGDPQLAGAARERGWWRQGGW